MRHDWSLLANLYLVFTLGQIGPDRPAFSQRISLQCTIKYLQLQQFLQWHFSGRIARAALNEIEQSFSSLMAIGVLIGRNCRQGFSIGSWGGTDTLLSNSFQRKALMYQPRLPHCVAVAFAALGVLISQRAMAIDELTRKPFLMSSDFAQMSGVSLAAQVPDQSMMLYDKSPTSSVWQTPMASRITTGGVPQIYYLRADYGQANYMDKLVLCLGEIVNGQWTPKQVSSGSPPWGGVNNVVMTRSEYTPTWGGFNPHQIVTDPSGGLLMMYWDQPSQSGNAGVMRATASSAGTSWDKVPGTVLTEFNDVFTLSRLGTQYRLYQTGLQPWQNKPYPDNLPASKRVITLRTSNDSASWTSQNVTSPMLAPDGNDASETEFYALKTFPYGSGYAGVLWKYRADPSRPNEHSTLFNYELVVSSDGTSWQRPYRNTDLGFFSYADPISWNGNLSFATQGLPGTSAEGDTLLKGWVTDRMVAAIGDGGTLRTNPFYFPSNGIDINANTWNGGWIDVTVCDTAGTPIVGWNTYRIQNDNGVNLQLPWSAGHEPVSLRMTLGGGAKVYGISARPVGGGSVPEPSSIALLAPWMLLAGSRRYRTRAKVNR